MHSCLNSLGFYLIFGQSVFVTVSLVHKRCCKGFLVIIIYKSWTMKLCINIYQNVTFNLQNVTKIYFWPHFCFVLSVSMPSWGPLELI